MSKKIYILLSQTGTCISKMIKVYTKAKYNHSSICVDDNFECFYSFGRKVPRFPLIGGFVTERLNAGVYKLFKNTTCCLYSLEIPVDNYHLLCTLIDGYKKNRNYYGYNLIGLFGVMADYPIKRRRKYFCSQFVGSVISKSNVYDFKKNINLLTPQDIEKIPGLTKIFEGKLENFVNQNDTQYNYSSAVSL